ncbi:hypothetical protein, partial [Salmonella enterica]|uniref:hypothetical protein n=1 Tax=Salmonella enterica TaxID=28901 RepID=UPI0039EA05A9
GVTVVVGDVGIERAQVDQPTRQHLVGFGTTESHQFYNVDDVPPGSIKLQVDNNAGPRPVDLALQREDALHAVKDVLGSPAN